MFQRLLIPLDGSPRAEQALPVAARLARASGGSILLLRVVNISQDVLTYGIGIPLITPGAIEDKLAEAKNYLDCLCQRADLSGIPVQTLALLGNPAMVITSQAVEKSIELIIISSHGYSGVKRWLLGSVAEKVAHHAPVPVFILREEKPFCRWKQPNELCSIRALVPLDTSARSQDVLAPAAQLVAALSSPGQGELFLATIVKAREEASMHEKEKQLQEAWHNLDAIKKSIFDGLVAYFGPDLHPTITRNVAVQHDIAEGIVQIAENAGELAEYGISAKSDLIAITTHGTGGLARWALGSVAERVLHSTRLPVLLVRPADMIAHEYKQQEAPVGAHK